MPTKKGKNSTLKSSVKRRTVNQTNATPSKGKQSGLPGHEQDIKRRLGNFTGAGEHARKGGRTSGIVGQTTKSFRTENRQTRQTRGPK